MTYRVNPPSPTSPGAASLRRLAAVGVAAGLLSGLLGVGGGIIIVPGLVWAIGLDRHTATGTSLLAILPIAVVGAVTYALAPGGAFDAPASAILVAGSAVGAVVGARVNARVSERWLRLALALLSGVFGVRLLLPLGLGPGTDTLALDLGAVLLLLGLGLAGGVLAGLLGVGGSVIVIAVLVIAGGTSQVLAQGIALTAVIPTVIVGAATHRALGSMAPRTGLGLGLIGMLGAVPGALVAFALPADVLRAGFGAFLLFNCARGLRAERRRSRERGTGAARVSPPPP
jgi:uncharacterized membrane protein YfcA